MQKLARAAATALAVFATLAGGPAWAASPSSPATASSTLGEVGGRIEHGARQAADAIGNAAGDAWAASKAAFAAGAATLRRREAARAQPSQPPAGQGAAAGTRANAGE